jgi:excisionase family DNA binding protein
MENYYEKLKAEFEPKAPVMPREELVSLIREVVAEEFVKLRNELQSVSPEREFLSVKKAAAFLNLAVTTLYEKTSLKLIPFHKRDKKLYFKKEELKEWLLGTEHDARILNLPVPKKHKRAA